MIMINNYYNATEIKTEYEKYLIVRDKKAREAVYLLEQLDKMASKFVYNISGKHKSDTLDLASVLLVQRIVENIINDFERIAYYNLLLKIETGKEPFDFTKFEIYNDELKTAIALWR